MDDNETPPPGGGSSTLSRPRLLTSLRPLYVGAPPISIQADATTDRAKVVAQVARAQHLGVIHTVKLKALRKRLQRSRQLIDVHRRVGADIRTVMLDASRYNGNKRLSGVHSLDVDWVQAQLDLGVAMALTDSPYIPDGDRSALVSVLEQTAAMAQPVTAVLPVGLGWLKKDARLLREEINKVGVPVALVLENAKDPLGVQSALKGLIHVLEAQVPVVLLRSDLAAVGVVACGASMGAIGTRPSLRHLYPITKGGGQASSVSAFVPHSMSYRKLDTINNAIARVPDNPEWFTCQCSYCGGRRLDWIDTAEDAYLHSIAAIAHLSAEVFDGPGGPLDARQAWLSKCNNSQQINIAIDDALDGGWEPQDFLGAWRVAFPPAY